MTKGKQSIKHIEKLMDNLEELRVVCECGHTKRIPVFLDSVICNFCGKKLINNTKAHFKYKLRKALNENKN